MTGAATGPAGDRPEIAAEIAAGPLSAGDGWRAAPRDRFSRRLARRDLVAAVRGDRAEHGGVVGALLLGLLLTVLTGAVLVIGRWRGLL